MRVVLQRVRHAAVAAEGREVARIGVGLLALVGVGRDDEPATARRLAEKTATLRLFPASTRTEDLRPRPFDRSVAEVGGAVLSVSQFTLLGDVRRGNRPSWSEAAPAPEAGPVVAAYVAALRATGIPVEEGIFGADMQITLENDGPVTLVLDSADLARARSGFG